MQLILTVCGEKFLDKDKLSALHSAAQKGHLPIVTYLLKLLETHILSKDKVDALVTATRFGQLAVVKYLYTIVGEDISVPQLGDSLRDAARGNHLETVQYFLKISGDKILAQDKSMAFSVAVMYGNLDTAHELMSTCPEVRNNIITKKKLAKKLLAIFEAFQLARTLASHPVNVPPDLVRRIAHFTPAFKALTEEERYSVRIKEMCEFFKDQKNQPIIKNK